MKIKVERTIEDKELVITLRISEPQKLEFKETELKALNSLKNIVDDLIEGLDENRTLIRTIRIQRNNLKDEIFKDIINSFKARMQFGIDESVLAIYNEIYNWTFDNLEENVQNYLTAFGFQKEKYYFDNDVEKKRDTMDQELDFDIDIDDGEDDE